MEKKYELLYKEVENIHPWFLARRKLFESIIKKNKDLSILDFGCGSGNFLNYLSNLGYKNLTGVEISEILPKEDLEIKNINIYKELPKNKKYDVILIMDVLEHIKDDVHIIKELKSHLSHRGLFIISVPTYQFLWSKHDDINHHYRRYNRKSLEKCMSYSNLTMSWSTYWNTILFPLIAFKRIIIRNSAKELEVPNFILRKLIYIVLLIEVYLIKIIRLPFGLSLVAIFKNE